MQTGLLVVLCLVLAALVARALWPEDDGEPKPDKSEPERTEARPETPAKVHPAIEKMQRETLDLLRQRLEAYPDSRTFSDAELFQRGEELVELFARNRAICSRPVLRGKPIASSEPVRLEELPNAIDAPCKAFLAGQTSLIWISNTMREVAPRNLSLMTGRSLDDPIWLGLGQELGVHCGYLAQEVSKASAHERACWSLTNNGLDFDLLTDFAPIKAATFTMRVLARDGKIREALQLGSDALRISQDTSRNAGLVSSMLAALMLHAVAAQYHVVLARTRSLEDLDIAARELDALLASEVHPRDILNAAHLEAAGEAFAKLGWDASRGWPAAAAGESDTDFLARIALEERESVAISWHLYKLQTEALASVCPRAATRAACIEGLKKLSTERPSAEPNPAPNPIGRQMAEIQMYVWMSPAFRYIQRHSWRMAALLALRLMVEFHREQIRLGGCPAANALDNEPLARYLTYPGLGAPLEVESATVNGTTSWTVSGPAWAYMEAKPDRTLVVLRCGTDS